MMALAIPNEVLIFGSPGIGLIATFPLYIAIAKSKTYKEAFLLCFIQATTTHVLSSFWLGNFQGYAEFTLGASAVGTGFVQAFMSLFFYFPTLYTKNKEKLTERADPSSNSIAFRMVWFAAIYTVWEWVKSTGFLGYPWGTLSMTAFRWSFITQIADITASMIETGLQIISFTSLGYDVIVYYGLLPILQNQLIGQYYAVMTDGVETWYSEVWTAIEDVQSYLKLEWYNKENVAFDGGQIVYEQTYYRNYLYLDAEIGKPEYKFEEEGEERDGYFFPEKQISEKVYKSVVLAPEFLCDCMRLILMADYVRITDKFGRVYNCDTFLITPEWQVQGDLASVEMEFQTDTVVKKIGRGYTIPSGADFNNDYNKDFNN
jgi:hypothetical protein